MSADLDCHEIRGLTAEVALGVADGEDRARVLEHVSECTDCRQELEDMTSLADELVVLAPEHEPPLGFELRTIRRLQPKPERRRRWRLPAVAFAAAALAATTATAGVLFLVRDDRRLASEYRATLSEANGTAFRAVPLRDTGGGKAGTAFVYEGAPSWMLVTVDSPSSRATQAELVTRDGKTLALQAFTLSSRSWGGVLPLDARQVAAIHLLDDAGRSVLVAYLPDSW
jgi:hypothetical protein